MNIFMEEYLSYTDDTEAPLSYRKWTALACLSAAVGRKCYMKWGHDTIFPNLYVLLVGPSGWARKGTAINPGLDLVHAAGLPLSADSLTREEFLRWMAGCGEQYTAPGGGTAIQSHAIVFSPEVLVFLGRGNIRFLGDLTDLYDNKPVAWRNDTKNKGKDTIDGGVITLLGGAAPDHLLEAIPREAIGGGFSSRCIFVVERWKGKTIVIPPPRNEILRGRLIHFLQRTKRVSVAFGMDGEASSLYADFYNENDRLFREGNPPVQDPHFAGYCSRRGLHVKKVAMLCALGDKEEEVKGRHMEEAISLLQEIEPKMVNAFGGAGRGRNAQVLFLVRQWLQVRGKGSRSELLRAFPNDLDVETLAGIENTLVASSLISVQASGGEKTYTWKGGKG